MGLGRNCADGMRWACLIGRGHVAPTLLKVALDRLEGLRMHGGRLVQGGSHGLAGQVVLGGAQSASRDNQVHLVGPGPWRR